jgi:hypothetical protein
MSKTKLFNELKQRFNIDRLIRADSRTKKLTEANNVDHSKKRKVEDKNDDSQIRKKVLLNDIDPIMFVPIEKNGVFKFSRPNGTKVRFNIESLVDYLLASGDFNDPETRIPFSDTDLSEIDSIVIFYLFINLNNL